MQKAYERVNWGNHSTPINEDNLNKMDDGIDKLDDRIVTLDSTKLDKTSANRLLSGMDIDDENSNIVLRYYGGGTQTIHTEIAGMAATAREAAEQAKEYAEQALSTTPGGYNQMVSDVDLLKNSIIRTTDRTLYGSKEGGIKLIGVKGASEQAVYSGAQLLNYDAWSKVGVMNGTAVFENNGVTLTATSTDAYTYHTQKIEVSEGDIITMSWESNNDLPGLVYIFPNDSTTGMVSMNNSTSKRLTYKVASGVTFITFRFGVVTTGNTIAYKNIMINKGDTALPWEPYVGNAPSPSPSYPQPIESVGDSGSLVIEQRGKNWLKREFVKSTNAVFDYATGTITGIATNNTVASTGKIQACLDGAFVKAITYNLSDTYNAIRFVKDSSFNQIEIGFNGNKQDQTVRFDCSNLVDGVTYYVHMEIGELKPNGGIISGVMITTQSEYDSTYEPYHSNTITIPLSEPLRGIGDIKDEIVCKDGVWGVLRGGKSVELDGVTADRKANSISTTNKFTNAYVVGTNSWYRNAIPSAEILCTHYTYMGTYKDSSNVKDGCVEICSAVGSMYVGHDSISTVDDYNAWLAEQYAKGTPVTVFYELDVPVFEPFTDQTPFYGLKSYDTVTYISTDSKVEPSIEVKFGRTEGDAINLGNYNRTKLNEIRISELMALQTELATALVAGSEV